MISAAFWQLVSCLLEVLSSPWVMLPRILRLRTRKLHTNIQKKTLLFFETSPRRIQRLIHLRPAVALAEHAVPTQLVHLAAAAPLAAAALLVAAQLVGPVVHAAPDMIIDISSPRCVS